MYAGNRQSFRQAIMATAVLALAGCQDSPLQAPPNGRVQISRTRVLSGDTIVLNGTALSLFSGVGDRGANPADTLSLLLGEYRVRDFQRVGVDSVAFAVPDTMVTGSYELIARLGKNRLLLEDEVLHVAGFTSYLERDDYYLYSVLREWNHRAISFRADGQLVVIDPETLRDTPLGVAQGCSSYMPDLAVGLSFRPGGFLVADAGGCGGPTVSYQFVGGRVTPVDTIPGCGISTPRHLVEVAADKCVVREKYGISFLGEYVRMGAQSWMMHLSPNSRWIAATSAAPWANYERSWPLIESTPGGGRFLYPFSDAGRLDAVAFSPDGDTLYTASSSRANPHFLDVFVPGDLEVVRRREMDSPALALMLDPDDPTILYMIVEVVVDSAVSYQTDDWVLWSYRGRKVLELIDTGTLETIARIGSPVTGLISPRSRWAPPTLLIGMNRAVYFMEPDGDQRWRFDVER